MRRTNESLNTTNFFEDDILNVIRKLDPSKAHGHYQISIRMVQICDKAICKPLHLIFSSCIESGIFPTECKMANVVPIYKRDDKQNVENYRPVSLLPTLGKILERLICNQMYSFFIENDFFFSIIITMYIDSVVTNILKIKVNKTRQHRAQNLQKTYTAYCKICT